LADRVNHQIMGTNRWFSAPSLEALNSATQRFHLSAASGPGPHALAAEPNAAGTPARLEVDLADREIWRNAHYYPHPILTDDPVDWTGSSFVSAPLTEPMVLSGQFSGALRVQINKRDVDIGVTLYELRADGSYIHLCYYLGRASYAGDMSRRRLLTPGEATTLPIERTRMVSRLLEEGSRIVAVLDVNVNPFAQINYGTGGDVSEESIEDAGPPLTLEWLPGSYLDIPLRPVPTE
jgi:predicted acyl esterase